MRFSAITKQRSLLGLSGLGALAVGVAVAGWRSIAHGPKYSRLYPVAVSRSTHSAQALFSASSTSAMATLTPPQLAPTWTHSAEDIVRLTKEAIAQDRGVQDKVAALAPEDCNFSSVSHHLESSVCYNT